MRDYLEFEKPIRDIEERIEKLAGAGASRASVQEELRKLKARLGDWFHLARVRKDKVKVLLKRDAIQRRVRVMAAQVARDFRGESVHFIGVLKGAVFFLADLVRSVPLETSLDFIAVSSYGKGTQSSGQVKLTKDLDRSIEGLNVILVEDILDTGLTLNYLIRILRQRRPKTLRIATLLDKPDRRIQPVHADYVGFRIPNEFVVGYGLDYAERYRNLRDICVLSLPSKSAE